MSINILGVEEHYLSVLQNCDDANRFNAWQATGGALLNNRNLGCGINSLTYLGIFTRRQGENLVNVVNARGTTFDEMMNSKKVKKSKKVRKNITKRNKQ